MVNEEIKSFLPVVSEKNKKVDTEMIKQLPIVIQKWLKRSNIIGKEMTQNVFLTQKGEMKTSPDGKWLSFKAKQYFNVINPGFIWKVDVKFAPFINLVGRDKYVDGKGHMLIKLLAVLPVADAKGNEIDQGTLLRYMAETIWFPSSALRDYIKWETIDANSAKASMSYAGGTASGIFKFNDNGDFISFAAKRYFDRKTGATLENWLITADENSYREFEGIRIPSRATVNWQLKDGDFSWLKLEVTDLHYKLQLSQDIFIIPKNS